jgi:Na+-transporting methylmalonyl-CoA/oxaloacetate decarboxylase gamma subunit
VFKYGGSEYFGASITISGSGGGGMGMGSIIIIVLVLIAVIGGLVYFFVEFEEEEDEQLDGTSEAKQDSDEVEDTYAWAKEAGIREEPEKETPRPASRLQKHDDHPGWLWDSDNEEWVPDPDHSDA